MSKQFDLIIFGATGFTGQFVVEELYRVANGRTWAVSGRNEAKLRSTLVDAGKTVGHDLTNIPVIIADVSDEASINEMARQATIVINCVGPYNLYGEVVVKACVTNKAHHVDISGEPEFLELMQLKYNDLAAQNGVYVVGACGWDSIPCEMGILYAKNKFPGDLNGFETIVEFFYGPQGSKINFGTYHSIVNGLANRNKVAPIRRELFKEKLPRSQYPLPKRNPLFYDERVGGWCLPFMGSDKSVVYRSEYYNYFHRNLRSVSVFYFKFYGIAPNVDICEYVDLSMNPAIVIVQLKTYMKTSSLIQGIGIVMWGAMMFILSSFSFTRELLIKYPEVFSFGYFSRQGPTREQLKDTKFKCSIFGYGWSDKLNREEVHPSAPDKKIVCIVEGSDPGYSATSACVVASAMTILDETAKLPENGGVFSPGAVFSETSMIDRLQNRVFKFTVVDN